MANHPQALKRSRQSEKRRQQNAHVKSTIRSSVKAVRYAVDQLQQVEAGRHIHPQEIEKHLKSVSVGKRNDYEKNGFKDVFKKAEALLKKYDAKKHATFLRQLAQADLHASRRLIGKAASKGVFPARTASRKISRLDRLVNTVSA